MAVEPYYDEAGITIYHGDCREVLPSLTVVPDLVLTDPPYGIGYVLSPCVVGQEKSDHGSRRVRRGGKPPVVGDDAPFDPRHLLAYPRLILFGANYYSDKLPMHGGWIVWDKTGGGRGPDNTFTDVELAWTNVAKSPQIIHHLWKGLVRDSETGDTTLHPTQKPVALMRQLIAEFSKPGDLILDPYMGSGPVARAAKDLGRRYVGIEVVEAYCEIAATRLAQGVLDFASAEEGGR